MVILSQIGARIKSLRKKKGLTQRELSALVGVSFSTLRRWEVYELQPRADEISRLAEVLGCNEYELVHESERIEITLVFGSLDEEVRIGMNDNKFKLFLGDRGEVGISGGGMFKSKEALKKFASDVLEQLQLGYDVQVQRGLIQEGK